MIIFSAQANVYKILVSFREFSRREELDVWVGGAGGPVEEVPIIYEGIRVSNCVQICEQAGLRGLSGTRTERHSEDDVVIVILCSADRLELRSR